jgi:DNA-binding IclR family transcriptional regulator
MNGNDPRIISALRRAGNGMTITELAEAVGRTRHTVARCLDRMVVERRVEMRRIGAAKVYRLRS